MVLVADHEEDARARVVEALISAGFRAREARTGTDAIRIAVRERPTAAVIEALLPDRSGYEVCRLLKERFGRAVPVVLVSGQRTEPADRVAGLLIGADDYLVKPVDPTELVLRLRRLLPRPGRISVADRLTPREHEVMALMTQGLDQEDIARALFITSATVAKHIEHILPKLGVRSRAQAVAVAMRSDREVFSR